MTPEQIQQIREKIKNPLYMKQEINSKYYNTSRNKEIIKNTSQNEVKKIIESKQLEFSF